MKGQAWGKVQIEYVAASYEWRISATLVNQCHAVEEHGNVNIMFGNMLRILVYMEMGFVYLLVMIVKYSL